MARSEAQKAADARYAKKINGNLDPAELARINAVIAASGMKKAEFLRWAVGELENKNK